jgi:glycerol-3-phosphate cytidylyltransferase-like family protein
MSHLLSISTVTAETRAISQLSLNLIAHPPADRKNKNALHVYSCMNKKFRLNHTATCALVQHVIPQRQKDYIIAL